MLRGKKEGVHELNLQNPVKPVFDNYGGCYHLRLSTVEDLEHLLTLDDGRWMATSCPLFGLNVDPAFLKFLDADGNGRIISDEVRAAVRWLLERLRPSETWTTRQSPLPLQLINTDHPDGKVLESVAHRVLENLNLSEAKEISLEQVRNRQKIMAHAAYNGDGVIPPEIIEDSETAQFARDLIATFGGVPDASGLKGVNEALLDQFQKAESAPTGYRGLASGVWLGHQQADAPHLPHGAHFHVPDATPKRGAKATQRPSCLA